MEKQNKPTHRLDGGMNERTDWTNPRTEGMYIALFFPKALKTVQIIINIYTDGPERYMDGRNGGMEMDRMDRGTDGWRDGGMDRMDGQTLGLRRDGLTDGLDGWTDGLKWTEGWTSLTDRGTERRSDGLDGDGQMDWTSGWLKRWT